MELAQDVLAGGPLPSLGGAVPLLPGLLLVFCLGVILIWAPVPGVRAVLGSLSSGASIRPRAPSPTLRSSDTTRTGIRDPGERSP